VSTGKHLVSGLRSGISKRYSEVRGNIRNTWNNIVTNARNNLGNNRLYNVGRNLLTGLYNGIVAGYNTVSSKISSIWERVTSGAQSAYDEHSPSKVFYKIGEFIIKGLALGIEQNSDDAVESFDNMSLNLDSVESFSKDFISIIARMTQDVTLMIDSMIEHINESISNLSNLEELENTYKNISKLSNVSVPKISTGMMIPSSIQVTESIQDKQPPIDLSEMSDIIKEAVIEALLDPSILAQNENGDTVIQIDGKNVFTAVRNQNNMYKKRTGGLSAFA
jgi:hypothetical protein